MRRITMTPRFLVVSTFDLPLLQGASLGLGSQGLKSCAKLSWPLRAVCPNIKRDEILPSDYCRRAIRGLVCCPERRSLWTL